MKIQTVKTQRLYRQVADQLQVRIHKGTPAPVERLPSERDLRMADHPVVWSSCVGKGRSVYAAMGHQAEAFEQSQFRHLLENALAWTMTGPC